MGSRRPPPPCLASPRVREPPAGGSRASATRWLGRRSSDRTGLGSHHQRANNRCPWEGQQLPQDPPKLPSSGVSPRGAASRRGRKAKAKRKASRVRMPWSTTRTTRPRPMPGWRRSSRRRSRPRSSPGAGRACFVAIAHRRGLPAERRRATAGTGHDAAAVPEEADRRGMLVPDLQVSKQLFVEGLRGVLGALDPEHLRACDGGSKRAQRRRDGGSSAAARRRRRARWRFRAGSPPPGHRRSRPSLAPGRPGTELRTPGPRPIRRAAVAGGAFADQLRWRRPPSGRPVGDPAR